MAETIYKFDAQLVGKISYGLKTPDVEEERVPGFTVNIEANINQFADPGEFINALDGNVKLIKMTTRDGIIKINFDAVVGKASIDQRVEFAGEEAIRFIAIPLNISRRHLDENDGIVALLDIFGQGTATISLSSKQLALGLKTGKKAAESSDEVTDKKSPPLPSDQPARAAAGRKPRGFDKSLN
ncbi:MAG: hypothetical protein WBP42_12570 [Candidatus Zixiibacteriota bacterium]